VSLVADMWRNLLWCGMIGAAVGLVISGVGVLRGTPTAGNSPGIDIASGVMGGIVVAVLLLGIPACVWSFGRWMFVSPKIASQSLPPALPQSGAGELAHDATHGAMVGSTAAIPGAIAGGIGGFILVLGYVVVVALISLVTFSQWYNETVNRGLIGWFAGFTLGGAILGALAGMVLGGTVGAIFGGVRSAARRHF
jgi:hypothetical protein